jgi:hypothetical protein
MLLPRPARSLRILNLATVIASLAAGLLIVQWLRAQPLWLDEEMIALNIRERSVRGLARALELGQTAPLGWLIVQRWMLLIFGSGERALRAVPVIFGIGTIATAVWVGRRWMTPLGAAVLVLLCSFGQWISFYYIELKPYSADAFWALLVPALAAWAIDPPAHDQANITRRVAVWWAVAAVGQLCANGALLVTPACAVVLVAVLSCRRGWNAGLAAAALGSIWLVAFMAHYALSMRHTLGSEYLRNYWAFAMPPPDAGFTATLGWLTNQIKPFALKPGGTERWVLFWIAAAGGLAAAIRTRPAPGLMFAPVPVAAFALAGLRAVPFFERLTLWILPALFVGIAVLADTAVRVGRAAYARARLLELALAAIGAAVVFALCADVLHRYWQELGVRPSRSNHALDDRTAVRWLMAQRQPGDVLVTTRLALPAMWWYAGLQDAAPMFEVSYAPADSVCRPDGLREVLHGYSRALVYLGFRFDDVPRGFDDLLLDRLSDLGTLVAYRPFAGWSRAAVLDLHAPSRRDPLVPARPGFQPEDRVAPLDGCLAVQPARRW